MSAFIRYSFFGCVILALSACSSSGSSRLLEPAAPAMDDDDDPVSTVQEVYSGVEYLITDTSAARTKFRKQVYKDADDNEYLLTEDNVDDMNLTGVKLPEDVAEAPDFADLKAIYKDAAGNEYLLTPANVTGMNLDDVDLPDGVTERPAFADLTKVLGGATALPATATPASLTNLRNARVNSANRYLSTGAVLARTVDGSVPTERSAAICEDRSATGPAKCTFGMDELRKETTFHLGPTSITGDNQVSFRGFKADREPVMRYREALMSQVRIGDNLKYTYEDDEGNEYRLTPANVAGMNLDDVDLPDGVTDRPDFEDLKAVYKDGDNNKYLLTSANVTGMNLDDVDLPDGVTDRPDFEDLKRDQEGEAADYQYVGYDGILRYSMFFVGVYRFFDTDGEIEHLRFENASLGQIYDENSLESGIQSPSVKLTGHGIMVGVEREISSLDHHPVQGDVNITYDPSVEADPDATPAVEAADAMIDIAITNVQRLADDSQAWYARDNRRSALNWENVMVTDSKFEHTQENPGALNSDLESGTLRGSFYGTEKDHEVGGVFHHQSSQYEIIGAFGSKLDPVKDDEDDEDDTMDPM